MSSSLNSTRSVLWAAVADGSFQTSVGLVGDGNSTRNRHISWENPRFPEDFPWNQFIDDIDARQPTTRKANGFAHELFGNMLISTIPQSHFLVNYCPISGQEFGEFFPAPAATGDWLDDKPILWFQEDLEDFEARLEKKAAWIRTATATGIWGILGRLRMVQLFGGLHGFSSLKYGRWPGEIEVLPSKNEGFHPWMGSYQHDTYIYIIWGDMRWIYGSKFYEIYGLTCAPARIGYCNVNLVKWC